MCAGSISVGLAQALDRSTVIALDRRYDGLLQSNAYARSHGFSRLKFLAADAYRLPFDDASFDAVLAHSIIETLDRPDDALSELRRILRPGGLIGAASVDYGGLIIAGGALEIREEFYRVREALWLRSGIGRPRAGRNLKALLEDADFDRVSASARYISYSSSDAKYHFASERARECEDSACGASAVSWLGGRYCAR